MITYGNYPLVLFTSYDKETAPKELPLEVNDHRTLDYLKGSSGFQELFGYVASMNSLGTIHNNYLLTEGLYRRVDSAETFRNDQFQAVFSTYIKSESGNLLFPNHNGQYVYILLSEQATKQLKGFKGRYIAVAAFTGNAFVGFEEGYVQKNAGIQVEPDGNYDAGMDLGGFISFVLICLGL